MTDVPKREPTEAHLRVLGNIAAGRNEIAGFVVEMNGVKAFFECVLYGWVCRGKLTDAGRAMLAPKPQAWAPILLPPSSLQRPS